MDAAAPATNNTATTDRIRPVTFAGAGLHLITVEHQRRASACPKEVNAAARLVTYLLANYRFIDRFERMASLRPADILTVAPYNLQVHALRAGILLANPELQIGTVDKVQGREVPVVIYAMCASTMADAPRGLAFQFDLPRFNVATSRAHAPYFYLPRRPCYVRLVARPTMPTARTRWPAMPHWLRTGAVHRHWGTAA